MNNRYISDKLIIEMNLSSTIPYDTLYSIIGTMLTPEEKEELESLTQSYLFNFIDEDDGKVHVDESSRRYLTVPDLVYFFANDKNSYINSMNIFSLYSPNKIKTVFSLLLANRRYNIELSNKEELLEITIANKKIKCSLFNCAQNMNVSFDDLYSEYIKLKSTESFENSNYSIGDAIVEKIKMRKEKIDTINYLIRVISPESTIFDSINECAEKYIDITSKKKSVQIDVTNNMDNEYSFEDKESYLSLFLPSLYDFDDLFNKPFATEEQYKFVTDCVDKEVFVSCELEQLIDISTNTKLDSYKVTELLEHYFNSENKKIKKIK